MQKTVKPAWPDRLRVYLILAFSAGLLLTVGTLSSRLAISQLGILSSFSVTLWFGLAAGVIAYLGNLGFPDRKGYLPYLYVLLLASLWLIPLLLGARQPYAI